MFLYFFLEDIRYGLVGRGVEMIGQSDLFDVLQVRVVVYRWVQVE